MGAALVVCAGVYAWLDERADGEGSAGNAERFRVELDVPPVDAALWFVDTFPDYVTRGEDGLEPWLEGLDPRDRRFVLAMAQTLTWAWVEHELEGLADVRPIEDQAEIDALAQAATLAVRLESLNQLEVSLDVFGEQMGGRLDAYRGDASFAQGVFARLVRGATNCDGQNHLALLVLEAAVEERELGYAVELVGIEVGHEVVHVTGPELGRGVYVDAWANLEPFGLDDEHPQGVPTLGEQGWVPGLMTGETIDSVPGVPWAVVPALARRAPHPPRIYAAAVGQRVELHPPRDAPTRPVSLEIRAPSLTPKALERIDDPWRLYLYARVLDLFDDPRAPALYTRILDRSCPARGRPKNLVCAGSILFHERATTPVDGLAPYSGRDRPRTPPLPGPDSP